MSAFPDTPKAAEAAAQSLNERGGIGGRPIEIVVCDDQRDPAKSGACAQQAVDEKVLAVTGTLLFGPQVLPVLEQAGIPVVGSAVLTIEEATSSHSFPTDGGTAAIYLGLAKGLADEGFTKIGLLRTDSAAAQITAGLVAKGGELGGATVSDAIVTVVGAPDFSPYAASALASDPDALVCVCATNDTVKLIQAARQQGFEGPIGFTTNILTKVNLEALGDSANNVWASSTAHLNPDATGVGQYGEDMAKHAPGVETALGTTLDAWKAIYAVAQVMSGASTIDSPTLVKALTSAKVDFGEVAPITDFTATPPDPERPRVVNWEVVLYKVQDGKLEQLGDFLNPYA